MENDVEVSEQEHEYNIYFWYLIVSIPPILYSWYMSFPRGFSVAFIGIAFGTIVLDWFKDDLLRNRRIWKEYFIGLIGIVFIPLYAINDGMYITAIDLYYYLIGATVFQIGIMPFFVALREDKTNTNLAIGVSISMVLMVFLSWIMFILLDVGVVH